MVRDIQPPSTIKLAKIHYFFKCACTSEKHKTVNLWFAAVSYFHEHDCKLWYGKPTQVWTTVTSSDIKFIPLSHIHSRVAYCSSTVNFGRFIGSHQVFVVVQV